MPTTIRPPAVAGQFYSRNPRDLTAEVQALLKRARGAEENPCHVVGMVVPHAGHSFSGKTAAAAYGRIENMHFDTIVILSPSHRMPIDGVSIYDGHAYETPLGPMAVDDAFANALADALGICRSNRGHTVDSASLGGLAGEHAIEVHLSFLQTVASDARIVPILMENRDPQACGQLGEKIAQLADGRAVLVIASSDLYHGVDGDACAASDRTTLNLVESFDAQSFDRAIQDGSAQACGSGPIIAAIAAVYALGATEASVVARCNSHQVTGHSEGYVVGYGAVLFSRPTAAPPVLTPENTLQLCTLARTAVLAAGGGDGLPRLPDDLPADAYLRNSAELPSFSATSVKAP